MAAALARSTARHRPAVDAVLRSTGAARLSPRRQLCDAAVAKIARTELNRVEEAAAARYDATGKTMDELAEKVTALRLALSKKQTDASLDLARTSTKVCALVFSSAVALGGFSYLVINPGGSSPPPAATKEIDKGMEEIKARLTGKISEWYEDEEAKSSAKVVVGSPPGSTPPGNKP